MAGGKKSNADAAVRLFFGEGSDEHDFQRDRCYVAADSGYCVWRSSFACSRRSQAIAHAGSGITSLLRQWAGDRMLCRTKIGPGVHQRVLPSHVILLRTVDPVYVSAQARSEDRNSVAAISSVAVSSWSCGSQQWRRRSFSLGSIDRIRNDLPGNRVDRTSARSESERVERHNEVELDDILVACGSAIAVDSRQTTGSTGG